MSDSQRARELLAQAFEASGHDRNAADVRRGFKPGHCTPLWMDEALSAIDQAIADERAAIVKWLRTEMPYLDHPLEYADAIESGEHSK